MYKEYHSNDLFHQYYPLGEKYISLLPKEVYTDQTTIEKQNQLIKDIAGNFWTCPHPLHIIFEPLPQTIVPKFTGPLIVPSPCYIQY